MISKRNLSKTIGSWLLLFFLFLPSVQSDPMLRIVGSSTVFPFAATVAEHFAYKTHEPVPLIETVGTGAGIKLFCGQLQGPDGVMASRLFTVKEEEQCRKNDVTFERFTIGQDGLVLIEKKQGKPLSLTLHDLDQALSEKIQRGEECVKNTHKMWRDIQPNFPSLPIRVLGPAPNSGTYDILIEKIGNACGPFLRRDGVYIEAATNENLIIQKVLNAPDTLGIVTFSFYDQNRGLLDALALNGVLPSLATIQNGNYLLSRPLYFYLKTNQLNQHPTRRAYALEFTSPEAIGEAGYLNPKGLIPLSQEEQKGMHDRAGSLIEK